MRYQTIQGEAVPALGLGTWRLHGTACREAVAHALDLGYRHIDTAQMYANEAEVGLALREGPVDREAVFITTKVWPDNLAPRAARRSAEKSLRHLQTEYVDLLLIHWPNARIPLEQTLDALRTLQEEGKTRHVGVSNFPPALLQRALRHMPLFCNQVEYHPYLGQEDLLALAREHDLLLTAYSPMAKGTVLNDATLRTIGEAHGKSPVQVALRWLIQQPNVAAIPRSSSATHRAQNIDLFDFVLSPEEMETIFALEQGQRLVNPGFAPEWNA